MDIDNKGANNRFDDIVDELSSASLSAEIIQLEFYCSISPQMITIHNNLGAPSGHMGTNRNYDFFFGSGNAHVQLHDLMYLGIYFDLAEMCDNVTALKNLVFEKHSISLSAWPDFSTKWELHGR